MDNLKDRLYELLQQPEYRSKKPPAMSEELNISLKELNPVIEELLQEGKAILTSSGKVAYPETHGYVRGTYDAASHGFGFIIPEDEVHGGKTFIPGRFNMGAMHGDRVMARVTCAPSRGKCAEGEIVRIFERSVQELCGTFYRTRGREYVVPDESKMGVEINIKRGKSRNARPGDKVLLRIVEYAKGTTYARGEVLRVLGEAQSLGANYESVLIHYNVRKEFPAEVASEAKRLFQKGVPQESFQDRLDLRDKRIFTIDGKDAKDFDDAVSLERGENGNLVLGVHIADVSHYVTEGSALDKEAYERGTSIYFIDQVVPMLPYELSNELCSLKPEEDRLALSVFMELDGQANVVDYSIHRSVIRSCKRCVYGELNRALEGDVDPQYTDILDTVKEMKALADRLFQKRKARGSLEFETVESVITLGEDGMPVDIRPRERGVTEQMIEEFMLAANETVAEHICKLNKPCVYRVHDTPGGDKAEDFVRIAGAMGFLVKGGSEGISSRELQELTEKIKGTPFEMVLSTMMLRSMAKARYSPSCTGHFGLGAKYYCHFTSPIRRYPDLIVHRVLTLLLTGKMSGGREEKLRKFVGEASDQSSDRELIAMRAERDIDDLYRVLFMRDKVGEEYDALIVSVTSFGFFVALPNTVEGLVHVSSLDDDYYEFDEDHLLLRGSRHKKEYRMGEQVKVTLVKANVIARQLDFILTPEELS